MQIGVMEAKLRKSKPLPEPQRLPVKPVEDPPVDVAVEKPVEKPPEQPCIGAFYGEKGDLMQIALICRTHKQARDYLCAMAANISHVQKMGISLSYLNPGTVTLMTGTKKQLDRAFFNRVPRWTFEETVDGVEELSFQLSASVQEQRRLQLSVMCGTPQELSAGALQVADAIWVLLDGHVNEGVPDSYESAVQNCLRGMDLSHRVVCMLMSQMETVGIYEERLGCFEYPASAGNTVNNACRSVFEDCLKVPAAVLPVQVYGGMDYVGQDEQGRPVLQMNSSRGYEPVACDVPMLYTVGKICQMRSTNYFEHTIFGGYLSVHKKYLAETYGKNSCQPPMIGGDRQ